MMKIKQRTSSFIMAIFIILFMLSGCKDSKGSEISDDTQLQNKKEFSIIFASDLHYLSPEMSDYGDNFMKIITTADGKVTHYTPELTKAFVSQVIKAKPDALVMSGDITLNGDKASHQELVNLLKPLSSAGIKVFIMPGNHDIDGNAYQFFNDEIRRVSAISRFSFPNIYQGMGYGQGYDQDNNSLSYTAKLNDKIWLVMIDVNANGMKGEISNKTLDWVEEQFKQAQKENAFVIGISHQNLLSHNKLFDFGNQMLGADKLIKLYNKYGVKNHFGGHMHLQHIANQNNINAIVHSSLAVSPNQYGFLNIKEDLSMDYKTIPIDVESWAKENNILDDNLLDFNNYAKDFFNKTMENRINEILVKHDIKQDEKQIMKDFAIDTTYHYFAGNLTKIDKNNKGFILWQKNLKNDSFTLYLESILNQTIKDMNTYSFTNN